MDAIALHLELRNAIALSDELSRQEHALGNDDLAARLAEMQSVLAELEREVGRSHEARILPQPALIERLGTSLTLLRDRLEEIPPVERPRVGQLMACLERIVFTEIDPSAPVPAKPVFGGLPVRRLLPQGVHTAHDYLTALSLLASTRVARTRRAHAVGLVLGAGLGGAALVTDSRLAVAKWLRIELHELIDLATGAAAVMAPFVLRYRRRDPLAATIHIAAGLGTILASLFTDYRAVHGLGRPVRHRGRRARRVPEVQRPLEGLANPSVLPRLNI